MTTSAPLFRIRDLHKAYGPRAVLEGTSFDVHRGECLVVLGRSGTGKSVMLRHLNGLERPDRGTVHFDDVLVSELEETALYPIRRRVAMLFQGGALFDSMNVFDNLAFPLRERAIDTGEAIDDGELHDKVRQLLARVRMRDVEDRMPSALSGGMRKRVALARALALDPEAMLYDEPTTGLDPVTSAAIARLIQRSQAELGVTAVVITHDLPLARTVADRIAFLDGGCFRFIGTWAEADASDDAVLGRFLRGEPDPEDAARDDPHS
ncbi:MAG: ATP-binding cassette domain-containing protein [Acidobacteriota bacterium]